MLLKLGRDVAPYEIYQMVHILMLLLATCSVPVPSSLKSNITICSCTGQNIQLKTLSHTSAETESENNRRAAQGTVTELHPATDALIRLEI